MSQREGTQAEWNAADVLPGPVPESLRREFEQLGLSPYESSVLLALLRLGSGTSLQLARVSKVPRTSTYQVLEELAARRLAGRVPGPGPAVWTSPTREEVFARLDAAQEDKLRQHRERADRVRDLLAETMPDQPSVAMPYVTVIHSAVQVRATYDAMLADAREEVVVFNRPPYSRTANPTPPTGIDGSRSAPPRRRQPEMVDEVKPGVLEALERGVVIRVLYQEAQWEDAEAESFRRAMAEYHRSGVKGRLAHDLPIKLAVADRRVAMLTMTDHTSPDIGFPTSLLIEHAGAAAIQADAFDQRWAGARPCPPPALSI